MNDNIDEWLSELGVLEQLQYQAAPQELSYVSSVVTEDGSLAVPDTMEEDTSEETLLPAIAEEHLPDEPLEDLNSILSEFGFNEIHEVDAEDVTEAEEGEEEEEENTTEDNDESSGNMYVADMPSQTTVPPLIQPNSPTLLVNESTSRFSGAEWFNEIQKQKIVLAGLGGIGSWTALQLARMNPATLFLYDDDTVERVNMSGQLYGTHSAGHKKASAAARIIEEYTTAGNVYAIDEKFAEDCAGENVMICGFDSMSARKMFFRVWSNYVQSKPEEEKGKCLFIDGRLSIDTLQVLCIKGDDEYNKERYKEKFLFSDGEADATVCSMKQTSYLACMIGSFIVNLFTNFTAGLLDPIIPYDLPFFIEYDAQNMLIKIEH